MLNQLNNNTGKLVRFILRRDRIRIPVWLISIILTTIIVAPSFMGLYPTEQDRIAAAETMRNPAMTAMVGPGFGLDNYTFGAIMAHQMLLFTALAVAFMSIFLVVRHTRGDEEGGRVEVIRSLPVGRLSNLSAAGIVSVGANAVLALVTGFGLYALGIETMDLNGSLLYGAALGATGIFFAAATALFAQLSENARGAAGWSFAFMGIAYLVRAIGDVSSEAISWLSPLGWILRTEVYVNNYWWPVILTVLAALVVFIIALYLNSIRDLGSGFIASKPGRKTASVFLKSPLGLGMKLQRTGIISWAVGMFILGASYGSVMGDMEAFIESNDMYRQLLLAGEAAEGLSLTEQFLPTLMSVISMISAIPALLMMLKLRGEEKKNRTEQILACPVSRTRLMGSFLGISIMISVVMQVLSAAGLWTAAASVMDVPFSFGTVLRSAMAYLPAIWIMVGAAVLLIGCIPQATGFSWLYLGYSFFVVYLGNMLQTPEWMARISPFGNIPNVPVEDFSLLGGFIMTCIAAATIVIGFVGYNKRDAQG